MKELIDFDPLKTIRITTKNNFCDFVIKQSEENKLEFDLPEEILVENYNQDDETIINIKNNKEGFLSKFFNFNFKSDGKVNLFCNKNVENIIIENVSNDCKIINMKLKSLIIENISGDSYIEKSVINNLYIKTISGDIKLHESLIKSLSIKLTSGDLFAKESSINKIEAKSISGDIYIDSLIQNFDKSDIRVVSGDIQVKVNGNDPIYLIRSGNKLASSLKSNIPLKDFNSEIKNRIMEIKSTSGDIKISSKDDFVEKKDSFFDEKEEEIINKIKNTELLTEEEIKILDLLESKKISKEFALELLIDIGYNKEEAEKFLEDKGVN